MFLAIWLKRICILFEQKVPFFQSISLKNVPILFQKKKFFQLFGLNGSASCLKNKHVFVFGYLAKTSLQPV